MDADAVDLEQQRPAIGKSALHQILHHLLLAVDGDALVDQRLEIDAVQVAIDADIDAPVQVCAFGFHALADAHLGQQIGGPMLDQSGADAVLDVIAAAIFDDDRLDAGEVQQPRQHQPGRPCSDNADLRAHALVSRRTIDRPIEATPAPRKWTIAGKTWIFRLTQVGMP